MEDSTYDEQSFEVMRRVLRPTSNCVDVGAHKGVLLSKMLEFASDGAHFAFEPLPEYAQKLRQTYSTNPRVHVFEMALSNVSGPSNFKYVISNPAYSGILERKYDRPSEDVVDVTVQTARLDELVPIEMKLDFIKIDVEGAELQVLQGAVKKISSDMPVIIFEHGLGAADCYGTRPDDIYNLLVTECGLKISLMSTWLSSTAPSYLTHAQFANEFWSHTNYYFMASPDLHRV